MGNISVQHLWWFHCSYHCAERYSWKTTIYGNKLHHFPPLPPLARVLRKKVSFGKPEKNVYKRNSLVVVPAHFPTLMTSSMVFALVPKRGCLWLSSRYYESLAEKQTTLERRRKWRRFIAQLVLQCLPGEYPRLISHAVCCGWRGLGVDWNWNSVLSWKWCSDCMVGGPDVFGLYHTFIAVNSAILCGMFG